jgi:dTMP kinase
VLEGESDRWSATTELLLFTAARRDHLERTILPALNDGKIVITDRFADSSRIYQGLGRAELGTLVDRLHELVIGREPDLTILVDMDPEVGLSRALGRQDGEDRFEGFGLEMQQRMREGFLKLAEANANRFCIVDGNRPIEFVKAEILSIVQERLS